MNDVIQILIANQDDTIAIQDLYVAQLDYHNQLKKQWNIEWMRSHEGLSWIQSYILKENKDFLIAKVAGKTVGYLQIEIILSNIKIHSKVAILNSIHVQQDHRGKGIGKKLVSSFFDYAKKAHASRAEVGVVENNEKTIKLYRELGFDDYLLTFSKNLY